MGQGREERGGGKGTENERRGGKGRRGEDSGGVNVWNTCTWDDTTTLRRRSIAASQPKVFLLPALRGLTFH